MKYLGIDFGLRRIGLAISEGELASAWKILEVRNLTDAVEKISVLISTEKFDKVVVGLPEGKIGKTVIGFIKALKKKGFDVESADETLSSKNATSLMIEMKFSKKRRSLKDDYSAMLILQNFLDTR